MHINILRQYTYSSRTIGGENKVAVRNCRRSSFDRPHRLRQTSDGGVWIKDNLCTVQAVGEPV